MMNSLKWTSIDLVVDASHGRLASGINLPLCLPLASIGCTYQASLLRQSVAVKSVRFLVLRWRDASLADWPLESNRNCLCYCYTQVGGQYLPLLYLQSGAVNSGQFHRSCRNASLANRPLESAQDRLCYR